MVYVSVTLVTLMIIFIAMLIIPTIWVKVKKVNQPLGIGKKVMQISDLHMERLRVSESKLQRIISKEKPDYIFITGDFLDTEESLDKLKGYLRVIKQSRVKTFAVLGNHDYLLSNPNKLINLLRKYNITVLKNKNIELKDFILIGIDDYCTKRHNIKKSFKNISKSKKRIIITHDPNIVLDLKEEYDYLMAGHLHGKQINIPFLFKFKPMGELTKKGIYKGIHKDENGVYYINSGLGQSGYNIRFMVRSEITIHEV